MSELHRDELFDPTRREPLIRFVDNPILIAQMRAQLRQKRAIGTIQITGLISILILFVTYSFAGISDSTPWASAMHAISWLLFFFLYWRGASYLMEAVASERESGIFIFLRSSPMSSLTVALGYLIGGASRAYVGALTLAIPWTIAGVLSGYSFWLMLLALAFLVLGALTLHSLVLLLGLNGQGKVKATLKIAFIILYFISDTLSGLGVHTIAHLTPIPALSTLGLTLWGEQIGTHQISFYTFSLSSMFYSIIIQGLTICACMWIAARKIEREGQPSVSRLGGLLMWTIASILVMGVDLNPSSLNKLQALNVSLGYLPGGLTLLILSFMAIASLLLISTPSLISFQRASARQGRRLGIEATTHLPWQQEGASLLLFCVVCVLALSALVCGYFMFHGGFEALKVGMRGGLMASLLSVIIALFALSGLSEHASTLARQQSYSLTLWVRLLTVFLLPLILALVAYQLKMNSLVELSACLSPVYAVFYAFKSFVTSSDLQAVQRDVLLSFSWHYYALSLTVGIAVSAWSYREAQRMKVVLLKRLMPLA